jgi:hypothetical protein
LTTLISRAIVGEITAISKETGVTDKKELIAELIEKDRIKFIKIK